MKGKKSNTILAFAEIKTSNVLDVPETVRPSSSSDWKYVRLLYPNVVTLLLSYDKLGEMTKRALKYIQREWEAMKNVLQFGDAELSNNLCEQMMRHIKINLKNSQNIGSEKCAKNFCFMYSLVESCDFNKLSPIKYISHLLKTLHYSDSNMDRRMLLPCYCNL